MTVKTKETPLWYYGIHTCAAILANPARHILRVCYLQEDALKKVLPPDFESLSSCEAQDRRFFENLFQPAKGSGKSTGSSPSQNVVHQGIAIQAFPLDSLPLESLWDSSLKNPQKHYVVVLDHVNDPHNVGAILRSAAVFGCQALVMTDRHAPLESATLAKSASGALEHVPLIRLGNLAHGLRQMQENGYWTIGLCEEGDQFLPDIFTKSKSSPDKIALILGAEGEGMRRLTKELCDFKARLPTATDFTTLNVSNAAAISFYEVFRALQSA